MAKRKRERTVEEAIDLIDSLNAPKGMRYVRMGTIPTSIRPGRVLMHNHIRHTIDMPCGQNGFRAWTDTAPPPGFVKCPCGWAGLPHYALKGHVKATKGRCVTKKQGRCITEKQGRCVTEKQGRCITENNSG